MKVTKRILRDMIESELINERVGQRIDVRTNKGQINRLSRQIGRDNQTAFNRQWRNEFMNLDASDFSNENYGDLLQTVTNAAVGKGWLEGSGGVFSLSAGRTSAGTAEPVDIAALDTPFQTSEVSAGDISTLDYLSSGGSVLKFGSSGAKVTALQNILNARLQSHGKEDQLIEVTGTFDSATKTAVETMQGVYGLQVDGIVGRQTWTALKTDGAEQAAVTSRAETAPADGAGSAEEEAAAAAAAAARPAERPEKPGPMFVWDTQKSVWYAFHNHYYYDEDPNNPIYQIWIVKDEEDFHIKMSSGDTWANVTQSDIDSLETAVMQAAAEEPVVEEPVAGAEIADVPVTIPESYSLAKVMLLEFSASTQQSDNNILNTDRDDVGRGEPILTLEDQGIAISERIQTFKNEITTHANAMADEGNKGFFTNSDEAKGMSALAAFDELSTELYDDLADKVKAYIVAGGTTNFDDTPSKILADKTGWQTVDEVQDKLDSFLESSERATMLRIIQRNNFPLHKKAREVAVSSNPDADQEAIAAVNNDLEELMGVIEYTAVVIAANSYDTRATWGGAARMLGSTASIASFFIPVYGQAAFAANLGTKAGIGTVAATNAAKLAAGQQAMQAARAGGSGWRAAQLAGQSAHQAANATRTARGVAALTSMGQATRTGASMTGRSAALVGAAAGSASIGGMAATALGLSTFGDNSDEDKVMTAINAFDAGATQFYINNSQRIEENDLDIDTPSQLLLIAYQQNVTSDDAANSIEEMIDQMDEFLGGGNYDVMKTQIERNSAPYSQHARQNQNESFTFDRFTKLAGLLKG